LKQILDSIYLNKRGDPANTSAWAYYRIRSLGGKEGDDIEICMVRWPTFDDLDVIGDEFKAIVVNPSDTGYTSAFPNLCEVLKNKWNIDHKIDDLIGFIPRQI
jgi:hypothetical protein